MKRKTFTSIMILTLTGTAFGVIPCNFTFAEETEYAQEENDVDFAKIAGIWRNENNSGEEILTLTEDGLFVYQMEEDTVQGYLKYTDEYGDGNGRYDMFNRVGIWIAGFYLDSETSLHMGNVDGAIFYKESNEDADAAESESENVYENPSVYVLMSSKRYTGLQPLYNDSNWEGGYFNSDMTADGMTVIVNCSAKNDAVSDKDEKEIRKKFAELVSACEISGYKEKKNKKLTKKFSYPVYNLSFKTGANEDTCLWKMVYIQTDDNTYGYAYKMNIDWADEMLEEYKNAINSLELTEILNMDNTGNNTGTGTGTGIEYDPSAEGQSLEVFIAYFDSWYQYGDLNAMNLRLYGEGTWEIYNSRNTDGSGGYLFDSGTFETSGTTALQLFSLDGNHVADVSLDGNGDLFIYPVQEGYGNIYAEAAFSRESDSIAYEAQTAGDDYVENSDPGDGDYLGTPYYWYDGEGNVMYFDGMEDLYMGTDDVFYIDEEGHLCQY